MSALASSLAYAVAGRARFVDELKQFVRFASVSSQPEHAHDLRRCARWLAEHLRNVGLEHVQIVPTARHPIVYADWCHLPGHPTVLIYGHYDVQPADPVQAWTSPPFEPTIRGDNLYGRGASDDKGQMLAHVKAIECSLRTSGALPVNIECLFEGEEEIGSSNLQGFLKRNGEAFTADVALISDNRMLGPDRPVITESLRGGLSVELEVRGQWQDLHSGNFGGAVHNPLQALCELIAGLHDSHGRVVIPGFYDGVIGLSERERAYMRRFGPSDTAILADAGATKGWGESDYTLYERTTMRPALTINGLTGGYQGAGTKAVIPTHASAKLNFRLVPDQDPLLIDRLFRTWIGNRTPPALKSAVRTELAAKPATIKRDHPAVVAAATAYRRGFAAAPVFVRSGGTIPVVNLFQEELGLDTVLMGFALPDDGLHSTNEKFHLPTFFKAIATSIHFLAEAADALRSVQTKHARGGYARQSEHGGRKGVPR
jgi:acetylornithine deacetylase/succinyl-diaminopimelate desuccinylase-like protein